jgi:hypothetical protein
MGLVKNIKDVQQLMGCLAALNQFVSRLPKCVLPLYKLLKKKSDSFRWMEEVQKALDELKKLITKAGRNPPPLRHSNHPGHQCSLSGGAGGAWTHLHGAKAGLLHQQSPLRLRIPLQPGAKITLRHFNYETQAFALLRKSLGSCGYITQAHKSCWEPPCHGKDCQVGSRAYGS